MTALLVQLLDILLILALAPLFTGWVRKAKARLQGRQGPALVQPYRDLRRLLRKEVVLAEHASWLFRAIPYLVFTATWLAASLIPTFAHGLLLSPTTDLVALAALLGSTRFFTALAGLDIGTSFGGIGASREMMIGSLAEPAMLMVIFSISLLVRSTSLDQIVLFLAGEGVGLRVSLALALFALIMVAIAENGRIPIDNPATHLELTMVHEAMILEYSGRHLALIEAAGMVKLLLYVSLIVSIFIPIGIPDSGGTVLELGRGLVLYLGKVTVCGGLLALFETSLAKMRVFRVAEFLGGALLLGVLGTIYLYLSRAI
jgi:formate hydrogenlyase subunit 4